MMRGFSEALRGPNGGFELNRLVGAFGGVMFVIGTHVFIGYDVIIMGRPFDVTAYCLAFPGGLGVVVGAVAGAVSWKDRGVARAKVIERTGE